MKANLDTADEDELEDLRVQVIVPWLPVSDAECVIRGASVTLRDAGGSEVRLRLTDYVEQTGKVLRFCSQASFRGGGGCIEFAGLGQDAWFEVECSDEATATMVTTHIANSSGDKRKSRSGA
jgi:hypothetical protein